MSFVCEAGGVHKEEPFVQFDDHCTICHIYEHSAVYNQQYRTIYMYVYKAFIYYTGIYGHSAVYNQQYKTIYIFGGHIYKDERLTLSEHLFTFDVTDYSWNILQPEPSKGLQHERWSLVRFTVYYANHQHAGFKLAEDLGEIVYLSCHTSAYFELLQISFYVEYLGHQLQSPLNCC